MKPQELKQIQVLAAVDDDALARLAAVLEEKHCADGQIVFAEGDAGDGMYFIVEGCVRIEKRARATGAVQKALAVLEAGDYFGEMALLDRKPRSASAVAAGRVRLLRLSKKAFDHLQAGGSAAGMCVLFAMIRTSGERIRRLSAHVVVFDEVGKAIGESRDLQTLLDVILQQLANAAGADWGLLLLRPQFSDNLEIRGQLNVTLTAAQVAAINAGKGFLSLVLENPSDLLVMNFLEQEPFCSCARIGFESASLLLSPIILEDRLLGLILLGGNAPGQFDLNALNLALGVARQAAQAILNARHREEEQARSRHSRQFVRF